VIINFIIKYSANIFLLFLISYSLYLGLTYAKYHIDPWHWGTIASESLDYINNFKLFKDITLMYGPGQPILFKTINNFYKIDYYSIGIITCFAYVTNILFCFLIFKKLSNKYLALLLIFSIIALLPYPQTPWPDFYAGLCITLSCFFLITYQNAKDQWKIYLSGIFLLLSIVFRNTYLIHISLAIINFYIFIILIKKKNIPYNLKKTFNFFFLLSVSFIIFLFLTNNLNLWYSQGIGRLDRYTEVQTILNNSVTKFIYRLLVPKSLGNFYFLLIYSINFWILIFFLFFRKHLEKKNEPRDLIIIFFAFLGLFGIIQSFNQFEIWRNINACIPIFFVLSYALNNKIKKLLNKSKIILYLIVFFLFWPMIRLPWQPTNEKFSTLIFPTFGHEDYDSNKDPSENWRFIYHNSQGFKKSNIEFFGNHLFTSETNNYYQNIKEIICPFSKIVNFTMDRTLVYICDKKNGIKSTFSDIYPPIFFDKELQNKIEKNEIDSDTIILADKNFKNIKLKLIKVINIPKNTRYTKGGLYRQYFDNEIFIYAKK